MVFYDCEKEVIGKRRYDSKREKTPYSWICPPIERIWMKSGISVIQQRKTRSDLYFKTSESAPNVRLVVEYFESCWWSEFCVEWILRLFFVITKPLLFGLSCDYFSWLWINRFVCDAAVDIIWIIQFHR